MFKQHYIFFTHTYFQKIQTTLLEQYYQTTPSQTKTVIYQLEKITVPFRSVMLFFSLPSVSSFYHHLWTKANLSYYIISATHKDTQFACFLKQGILIPYVPTVLFSEINYVHFPILQHPIFSFLINGFQFQMYLLYLFCTASHGNVINDYIG